MIRNNNNNFSVIPFYNDLNEQNHKKAYSYGYVYDLLVTKGLLPFQIMLPKADIDTVETEILTDTVDFDFRDPASFTPALLPGTASSSGAVTNLAGFIITNRGVTLKGIQGSLGKYDDSNSCILRRETTTIHIKTYYLFSVRIYTKVDLSTYIDLKATSIGQGAYEISFNANCFLMQLNYSFITFEYKENYNIAVSDFTFDRPQNLYPAQAIGKGISGVSLLSANVKAVGLSYTDDILLISTPDNGTGLRLAGLYLWSTDSDIIEFSAQIGYITAVSIAAKGVVYGETGWSNEAWRFMASEDMYYDFDRKSFVALNTNLKSVRFTCTKGAIIQNVYVTVAGAPLLIDAVELYTKDGLFEKELNLTKFIDGGLTLIQSNKVVNNDTSLVYPMQAGAITDLTGDIDLEIPLGRHYIALRFNDGSACYSDIFTVVDNISECVEIDWSNRDNLAFENGFINYKESSFINKFLVKTEIGRPDYNLDEEGEDRDGYFFPEKQISKKIYKLSFVAPEYLCDALRLIPMSDSVVVYDGNKTYKCDSVDISVEWQEQGDLAAVSIELTTDTVVKKIAKAW